MAQANRGTKRRCGQCGTAFYDLERSPIVCPKCQAEYVAQVRLPMRPPRTGVRREEAPLPVIDAVAPFDDEVAVESDEEVDEDEVIPADEDQDETELRD